MYYRVSQIMIMKMTAWKILSQRDKDVRKGDEKNFPRIPRLHKYILKVSVPHITEVKPH